ncbi:hypothetical protein KUTeg_024351 [Tegillarca granosa]|uniref:Uncharacterized protein n=1 Tax=Tegillarca granosa TaxID=220873 RepID=A0ABQ9E2U4_TEGGR|nr:hypothetical protein KUTeg_024351 [Tegillarca granosa]
MMRELRRPTPETLMLQRDMEKLRESMRQEQTLFNAQKTQMDKRLQEEMDRNRELLRRFEEQTLQMKEMNRELVDARSQVSMATTALNNEVYRRPGRDGEGNRSVSFHTARRQVGSADSADDEDDEVCKLPGQEFAVQSSSPRRHHGRRYDTDDVYNDIEIEYGIPSAFNRKSYTDLSEDEATSTASGDIVAETKYRLKNLEKEAQNLEKAYHDFHYKITNPATSLPTEKNHSPHRRSQSKDHYSTSTRSEKIPSPTASPIHRPMSSTPYQGQREINDSLHELTAPSSSRDKPPPRFDLSNMSDDENADERIERPRPITVSDLEARPGSPSIVVVPGSGSSAGNSPVEQKKLIQDKITDTPTGPPPRGKLPPLSLDDAWKTPSLDDRWKSQPDQDELEKKKKEEEELRIWEEERKRKEEERKRKEQEEWEREQKELQKLQKSGDFGDEDDKTEQEKVESANVKAADDGIDPVMQQYMAMVQQQKEKEKEVSHGWLKRL